MNIDNLNEEILEKGFEVPKIGDALLIILIEFDELFYRLFLLIFYLLGCFKLRYYQFNIIPWALYENPTRRWVSFHLIEWNPLSLIASVVFNVLNIFYVKEITEIRLSDAITIDIDENYKAYIRNVIR